MYVAVSSLVLFVAVSLSILAAKFWVLVGSLVPSRAWPSVAGLVRLDCKIRYTVANDGVLGTESLSFIAPEFWVIVGSLAPSRAFPSVAGLVRLDCKIRFLTTRGRVPNI